MVSLPALASYDLFEKVVTLVVDNDECGKVLDRYFVDGFHAQLLVLDHLYIGNVVVCDDGRRAANRPQIETAVLLTCFLDQR